MNNLVKTPMLLIIGLCCMLSGCVEWHHSEALYDEAPRPPLEKGREHERKHRYAEAEQEYIQITDEAVREMTLNQLTSAWNSVNANIIRAQEVVKQQPRLARARLQLAREYYTKGLLCARYWKESMGDYPHDFVLDEQEYFFRASLEQAQKALRYQPVYPEARLLMAETYLANHLYNEALKELKQLVGKHPEYAKGYYAVGNVYFEMKQHEKVERYYIRAIKLDPDFLDAYYMLGKFYLERQWYDYAAYTYLELLRKNPRDWPSFDMLIQACHQLGDYYVEQERYNQAIGIFQAILEVKASYPVHQSLLQARQKREQAALIAAEQRMQAPESSEEVQAQTNTETTPPQPELILPAALQPGQLPLPQQEPLTPPEEVFPGAEEIPVVTPAPQIHLRNTPATLSNQEIIHIIQQRGFNHPNNLTNWGLSGTVQGTFQHAYQPQTRNNDSVVTDQSTGLIWQQAGSANQMTWNEAKTYIQQLNQEEFAGFTDWRLPTVEELASLLEFQKKNGNDYIDPVFDAAQGFCWTVDMAAGANAAWAVAFHSGHVYYDPLDRTNYVRAVR